MTATDLRAAGASTGTGRPVLEIRDLHVAYGYGPDPVRALRGVNLTLHEGEVLGIAGESGCGKSTLVYAATRLLPPPGLITGGEVLFHGGVGATGEEPVDILRMSDKELRRSRWQDTAIVFQGAMNSLNPVYRVGKQLTDAIAAHRPGMSRFDRNQRAADLLSMVGIATDRISAYPHQLSGGMRQRVMIAMALALEPKVLIMDEPTTALDVVMQRQIVEQIIELRDRLGFSVVFITHDVSLLIEVADRIAIMYAGEIVEQASASDVYRRPRHPYTHGLLNSFPPLHGPKRPLVGIPGSPPDLQALPSGCPFRPRCAHVLDACADVHPTLGPTSLGLPGVGEPGRSVACLLHDGHGEVPAELRV
ncbi:ABC transporter ATP-binding protein [Oerskovia jenensis]|uniref:ABC transporter ATP-binding protein n=1 Tax=Oerskovia jenensis TaxID=162169 RepID=UPI0036D86DE3